MRSPWRWFAVALLPACGGGSGAVVAPVAAEVVLHAADVEMPPAADEANVVVELGGAAVTPAPTLLELAVELPPALRLAGGAAAGALARLQAQPTLEGELADGRLRVVCGDAQNRIAAPLAKGPLFAVRIAATAPRAVGTHSIVVRDVRAAASDGAGVPCAATPLTVRVTIR